MNEDLTFGGLICTDGSVDQQQRISVEEHGRRGGRHRSHTARRYALQRQLLVPRSARPALDRIPAHRS